MLHGVYLSKALNIWREIQFLSFAESKKGQLYKKTADKDKSKREKAFSKGKKRTRVNQSKPERFP